MASATSTERCQAEAMDRRKQQSPDDLAPIIDFDFNKHVPTYICRRSHCCHTSRQLRHHGTFNHRSSL